MRAFSVLFSIFFTVSILLTACGKDDKDPDVTPEENKINTWIYTIMDEHYLWYSDMPAKKSLDFTKDPEDFFGALLSNEDGVMHNGSHMYFSYIKEKTTTKSIPEESPTYGFEFVIYNTDNNAYYAQILYVIPNSPADKAGLKRGDWITSIGESEQKITDYSVLESGDAVRFNVRNRKNNAWVQSRSVNVDAAVTMEINPFIKDTVIRTDGKTIGYLAYTHFASGPNNNADKAYDNQMKELFARFKTEQVDEFVLDLRYNGGGLVSSARLLTSLLVKSEALTPKAQVFCKMVYNDKKTRSSNTDLSFENSQDVIAGNLNLSRLYVLTGEMTASASEAVINTLIPYMPNGKSDIWLIGEKTIGKTVGSNTFGENESYGWILHPIVVRIYNKDGKADYANGFAPDTEINEFVTTNSLYPLGDPDELLFAEAIRRITGNVLKSATVPGTSSFGRPVYSSIDRRGIKGLIVDHDTH